MNHQSSYEKAAWQKFKKSNPVTYTISTVLSFGFWSFIMGFLVGMFFISAATAGDLTYKFNNPSFNGIGYSSHVLTIENLTHTRRAEIKSKQEAAAREIEREKENSNVNKFLANLESRIYAELSKQISDKLFGENPQSSGTIDLLGNTVAYEMTDDLVTLNVTQTDGSVTKVEIPVASFAF